MMSSSRIELGNDLRKNFGILITTVFKFLKFQVNLILLLIIKHNLFKLWSSITLGAKPRQIEIIVYVYNVNVELILLYHIVHIICEET